MFSDGWLFLKTLKPFKSPQNSITRLMNIYILNRIFIGYNFNGLVDLIFRTFFILKIYF